jgi:ATP/maltotriose-dependent transcriptional regulator MalT
MAFVAGESGVGKTRLVAELERAAASRGVRVLGGECVDLGEGELAYAPLVGALRPLARAGDPALESLPQAAREALRTMLPGLAGIAPSRVSTDEAAAARGQLFEALLELFERLGSQDGLLLVIEDLHWADRSTRAFLTYLASSLCTERVLVVASYRADELHRRHPLRPLLAELERAPRARRIELRRFTREELAEQLADILGGPPAPDLLDRLWTRSEGNALFAEELLAAGLDGRGALPPTLREALMVRVERLSPNAQDVLRLLALSPRLSHDVLAEATALDAAELRDATRDAVAAQLLVIDDEGRYAFRHALLREVIHDDLLPGERSEMHLALARALESRVPARGAHLAAAVAYHYSASGDQPAALAASVRAAEAAEGVHAYGEAAALYERALELWDRVPDAEALSGRTRVAVLRAAAWCHHTEHDPGRAETLLKAAVSEVDEQADPRLAASVLERLARQQWSLGRPGEARDSRERALALLPDDDVSEERATILASWSKELMLESRYREAVERSREAIDVARAAGAPLPEVRALDALGVSLAACGEHEEGFASLRASIELAREAGMAVTMLASYHNLADTLNASGRLTEAREVADEARRLAVDMGHHSRWLDLLAAELAYTAGDWSTSEELLPEAGRRTMGNTYVNEGLRRAELALGLGEHERVRQLLEDMGALVDSSREPQFIGPSAALAAELERRAGDLGTARAAVDDGLDRIEFCSEDVARISLLSAVGVRVEADAALRARDLADPDAERLAVRRTEDLLLRVEACATDGRPLEQANHVIAEADAARVFGREAPALYAAAAGAWAELERPYAAADARARQAEAELASGDRDAAAATAARALEAARAIGAHWLAAEIEGFAARARLRLAAHDADADQAATPAGDEDPFGLTPRERQVLELLADGRTNREIGQTLFMAEKTASVHVSRILSKLDVRSRTEAAAVAHRLGLA